MRRAKLVLATVASEMPMGAQHYQDAIAQRAEASLRAVSSEPWVVAKKVARSLRSSLDGDTRLPLRYVRRAGLRERLALGRLLYPSGAVVHRMDLSLPPARAADVVTLHDVVAWRFPDEEQPATAAAEELRRADAVICVSEFTAAEAVDLLDVRDPVVIPNGVDERLFDAAPLTAGDLQALGVQRPYALYAGGSAARKNLPGLAAAWSLVRNRVPDATLVLAGPRSPLRDGLFAGLGGVVQVGRVNDATLAGLMATATSVVVPSLYEGFGLPALEALAVGVPLVCAQTSSLPEVVGDAALLVEPTADCIAQGLEAVLLGEVDRGALVERGRERALRFTWDASAERHAQVWSSLR